jgi:hypothetical protein
MFKSHRAALILIVALGLFCLKGTSLAFAQEKAVYSTSFEQGSGWGKLSAGASLKHSYTAAHGGEQYIAIKGLDQNLQTSLTSPAIPVTAGTNYDLSFAYRFTPKVTLRGIQVMLYFLDAHGKRMDAKSPGWQYLRGLTFTLINGPGTGQWQMFSKELVIPKGCAGLQVEFWHHQIPIDQEVDIDDLRLTPAKPRVVATYAINSSKQMLNGNVEIIPHSQKVQSLHVLLREYDGAADHRPAFKKGTHDYNTDYSIQTYGRTVKELTLNPNERQFKIDLSQLEDRGYTLSARAELADGQTLRTEDNVEHSVFYVMKHPKWAGNALGKLTKEDAPPAPWVPLKYDSAGRLMTASNYQLAFGDDLTLANVDFTKLKDAALLSGPQRLLVEGKAPAVTFGRPAVLEQTPSLVTLESRGAGKDYDLSVKAAVDFSGFIHYTMTFKALRDSRVGPVELVFPLESGVAKFVHAAGDESSGGRMTLEAAKPAWTLDNYRPTIWIGNGQSVGLLCSAPSDHRSYMATKMSSSLPKLSATVENNTCRLSVMGQARVLKAGESAAVEYALQVTPIRPAPKNFRDLRMYPGKHNPNKDPGLDMLWAYRDRFLYFGFPTQRDHVVTDWAKGIKAASDAPCAMIYLTTGFYMTTLPAGTWFADRWRVNGGIGSYNNESAGMAQWTGDLVPVNADDPLWQDYFCYRLNELLDQAPVDGLYFDVSGGGMSLMGQHEFYKRIEVILKRHHPEGLIMFHSGTNVSAPYAGFADLWCRGEEFRTQLAAHPYYLDFMSLADFRSLATITGGGIMFLPQYKQSVDQSNSPQLASQTFGLILLHDMNIWPSWMNQEVIKRVWDFEDAFGRRAGAAFYPYWKKQPGWIKSDDAQVIHSTFDRNGDLFVVLFNSGKKPVRTRLHLDAKAMGARKAVLFDPATGTSQTFTPQAAAEGISLDFPEYGCRLLRIQ